MPTRSTCAQPCEVYSRVVGYHRPVTLFNKGQRAAFNDRKVYALPTPASVATHTAHPKDTRHERR